MRLPENRKFRNRTDGGKFFEAKFMYFFHAAAGIPFRVSSTFGHSRSVSDNPQTQSVECSKLGKTRIIEDGKRGMVRNTGFCGQNCRRPLYPELSVICFLQYHRSRFSFYVNCFISSVLPRIVPMAPFTSSA